MLLKPHPLALSVALACGLPTLAQADDVFTLDDVLVEAESYQGYAEYAPTSGTKSKLPWQQVPQSVSVVSGAEMQDKGALRLEDALEGVAGVNNTLGEGSRDQFVIRGFDALNDTYRDGLRDDGGFQTFRSLANIERVEVVKGPAGALYGRGSAGGIINLISKRADGKDVLDVSLSTGSDNRVGSRLDAGSRLTDSLNGRINLEWRQGDSHVDEVDYSDYFIAPTVRWQLDEQQTLDLDLELLHQEVTPYRGVPSVNGKPVDVSVETYYGARNDFQEADSQRLALTHKLSLDGGWEWVNRAAYNRITLQQKGTRNAGDTDERVEQEQTVNNFGFDPQTSATLQSELSWNTEHNQLLMGVDYNAFDRDFTLATLKKDQVPAQDLFNPAGRDTANPGFAPFRQNSTESLGVYGQNVVTLGSWSLLGGLRYDRMELEQQFRGATSTNEDEKLSPRLGLVYTLSDELSFYGSWGRSWQLPYGGIYINPKLAEFYRTDLLEAGVKSYLFEDRLMLHGALFRIDQQQPETNSNGEITARNEFRHEGLELEARGQITDAWNIAAGYSYLEAKDRETGYRPNDVSDHLFSLWTTYQTGFGLKLGGGVKYVGNRFAGNNEAVTLGDYTKVDLMAAYSWQKRHTLQLNLDNVLNEKYILGATAGSTGANQLGYGAPTQWMLSYRYQL
ncbi:TonB-dependent receptor [Oceanimonas marisflavi]|uniref:TonB-dependent receptor n=1 Tax=Oceanimonas marisflavi TaxID=2059724 RepID=UPI000D30E508|nr:TonB-dependent siderophore receptor [Oceanimonas marisflavi]